jgi:O-antigen/teichoic acid export membrane protein
MTTKNTVLRWVAKGGLAVVDQGLTTGSNFLISILLARWLPAAEYGAYAVAFAIYLLIIMLYQSVLLEPMSVYGPSAYRDRLRSYFKSLWLFHLAASFLIFFLLIISAGVAFRLRAGGSLAGALAGIALAAPLVLLAWLVKRAFYLQLLPGPPAASAFVYCAFVLAGLGLFHKYALLSPFSALLLMGIAGLGSAIPLILYLLRGLPSAAGPVSLSEAWSRHWGYGRWALASYGLQWVPNSIFYPIVSSFSGMAEAGQLRALMNFSSPVFQGYTALVSLLLPYAARIYHQKGSAQSGVFARRISELFVSGAIVYWCLLLLFREPAFRVLYSGKYLDITYLLPIVALSSIFWCMFVGPATVLRAMDSPASVLVAVSISSIVSAAVGIPATWAFGIKGALWAITATQLLGALAIHLVLRRKIAEAAPQPASLGLRVTLDFPSDSSSSD